MVMWNTNVDALLFKHILRLHEIKPNYEKLCKAMREEGIDVTHKAIMHRFAKLRATKNEERDPNAAPLGDPVIKPRRTMAAGKKRESSADVKKEDTPKKVRLDGENFGEIGSNAAVYGGSGEEEEEEEDVQPVPKKRKLAKKVAKKPVVESEEDENDGDAI